MASAVAAASDQPPAPNTSNGLNGAEAEAGPSTTSPPTHDLLTNSNSNTNHTNFTNAISPSNGISASSSTSTLEDYKSPPAQIVSDIAASTPAATDAPSTSTAPSTSAPSTSATPSINKLAHLSSQSHGNANSILPRASHSPALPSTPVPSTHSLPKGGTPAGRWAPPPQQQHLAAAKPPKVPIVDPGTGTGKQSPAPRMSVGFPSPKGEAMRTNQKFLDDCDRLKFGIQQALPEAVRRSVRDNWEACLLGSDFHQAFVLNASIHHATPAAIKRGMRDFGKGLITSAKAEIVQQMTTADLDQLADLILSKASVAFFDKTLEQRLKTIDAKRLINALARAERLGYELDDVQEEEDAGLPAITQAYSQPSPAMGAPDPVLPASQSASALHCTICFRRFPAKSAYDHHVKGRVCTRSPSSPGGFKYSCQHCGQGFTTPMGLQYHNANKVCGDFGEPANANLVRRAAVPDLPGPSPGPAPIRSSQMPIPVPAVPSHVAPHSSSPSTPSASKTASPAQSLASTPNVGSDPYEHLSPEQLAAMQSELREAEIKFTERMRQANLLIDPMEKKLKLDGLSNSFGTKQSMIRKKYGVRLRNRRTKVEIQQERDRMQYKTASEVQAELGGQSKGLGRPVSSSYRPEVKSAAASGTGWAPVNQPTTTLASNVAVPAPQIKDSNNVSMHGGKRRFSGGEASDSKRVAYADMGGLSGAKAEAETKDPTLAMGAGTKDEPMALDDSSSGSNSSDSESGDEDIPAVLPASVRQTLVRSSPAVGEAHSRPNSTSRPGSSSAAAAGI